MTEATGRICGNRADLRQPGRSATTGDDITGKSLFFNRRRLFFDVNALQEAGVQEAGVQVTGVQVTGVQEAGVQVTGL